MSNIEDFIEHELVNGYFLTKEDLWRYDIRMVTISFQAINFNQEYKFELPMIKIKTLDASDAGNPLFRISELLFGSEVYRRQFMIDKPKFHQVYNEDSSIMN